MKKSKNNLVWIDCEMTGLDPDVHSILEIAVIVTNGDLDEVVEGPDLVIAHNEEALSILEPWSRDHHTKSGLVDRVLASDVTMSDAGQQILDFISTYCPENESPLCGNSVCYDRRFIQKQMPRVSAHLNHRHIDVSTIKELVRHWYPNQFQAPPGAEGHRAMADIRESIVELQYYRERLFITPLPMQP